MSKNITALNLIPRHQRILDLARQNGFLSTEELTRLLKVTPQTIRRDINELCEKGVLRRYHGGAGLSSSIENIDYATRHVLNREAKIRMAEVVAQNIPNNASLFINIGTSTEQVAKALRDHKNLRIITNNLNIAALLCDKKDFEIIIAGGAVRADRGIIGEPTIDFIRQFKVDYGIIGISGIDSDGSLLDFDYREVHVAQAIIENSRQVFLVADHTKFAQAPMVRLGHLSDIDAFFTDQPLPADVLPTIEGTNLSVHIAAKAGD